jgi:hypothetical protein
MVSYVITINPVLLYRACCLHDVVLPQNPGNHWVRPVQTSGEKATHRLPRYCLLRAATGESRAARRAGRAPKTRPVVTEKSTAKTAD